MDPGSIERKWLDRLLTARQQKFDARSGCQEHGVRDRYQGVRQFSRDCSPFFDQPQTRGVEALMGNRVIAIHAT